MLFLIKIVLLLAVLSGVLIYGGEIWDRIKERVTEFTDPELQRANILDSLKTNFSDIESIIKKVNENLDNPDFDKKFNLSESLRLIEESKKNLEEVEQSDSTLIEKTFEGIRDLKEGVRGLFSEPAKEETGDCRCSLEE